MFTQRESKDDSIMELMINEYKNKGIKFEGNFVFVYNRKEKNVWKKAMCANPKDNYNWLFKNG